jgi:hypothetical protein
MEEGVGMKLREVWGEKNERGKMRLREVCTDEIERSVFSACVLF